jgi:hypothetical protein
MHIAAASFEVAILRVSRSFNPHNSRFFVLVLSLSGTRTRTRRYPIEYEDHFIEYEYER